MSAGTAYGQQRANKIRTFISMKTEVIRFYGSNTAQATLAFEIRHRVFVEEQAVDPAIEYDGEDIHAHHYLLLADEKPAATARWRETDKGIKLERFAVLPEFRGSGLGGRILEEMLVDVIPLGKRIFLHSQEEACGFYLRYGFVKRGRPFLEADIRHYVMDRPLSC